MLTQLIKLLANFCYTVVAYSIVWFYRASV